MKTELIVTTYNSTRALALCLLAVSRQSAMPDQICIADDGSGPETAALIEDMQTHFPQTLLRHVWHADTGFEKCAILNKAISSSTADYLIFLDGDVLIHPDFVARHLKMARRGTYMTGSHIKLDMQTTDALTDDDVTSGRVFSRDWLKSKGAVDRLGTWLKTMPFPHPVQAALDRLTPVKPNLAGGNWSAFREDIEKVNGFDESIKYGGLDKEMGVRLQNAGIKGRHLRYTAPLVHQDHPRGYRDPDKVKRHKALIKSVRESGRSWTTDGIIKGEPPALSR